MWTGTVAGHRRRRVRDRAGDARRCPATTPTASRSRRARRSRASQTACAEVGGDDDRPRRARRSPRRSARRRPRPGAPITDSVVVSGLGKLGATVNVELWGPYPDARGDRPARARRSGPAPSRRPATAPTRPRRSTLTKAGYYTYRESIAATEGYDAVATACGEVVGDDAGQGRAEGHDGRLGRGRQARTREIVDTLTVSGLGQDAGHGRARALRPVRVARGHRLRGRAVLEGQGRSHRRRRVHLAEGDRPARRASTSSASGSPRSETVAAHQAECQVEAETSLAGAGDPRRARRQRRLRRAGQRRPVAGAGSARLRIDARGVARSGSTSSRARSGIPTEHQAGRLVARRRGARRRGGHGPARRATSTAPSDGAGAFYALKSARRGDTVTAARGRQDAALPRDDDAADAQGGAADEHLHAQRVAPKLVLVTCGGPFDAKSGHYRDNIVVTATPA